MIKASLELWLLCPGRPFSWLEMVPKVASCCKWEASCRGKSPRLGGKALGSIPGSALTLHMTLNMILIISSFPASVCPVRGWTQPAWTVGDPIRDLPQPPVGPPLSVLVHLSFGSTGSRPGTGSKQQPADSPLPGSGNLYARVLLYSLGVLREAKSWEGP